MEKQRGSVPIGLIVWGIAGLVLAAGAYWVAATWKEGRAAVTQVDAIRASLNCAVDDALPCVEKVKASLADCGKKYSTALDQIKTQNKAVGDLEAERKAAMARAAEAQKRADALATGSIAERERLQALIVAGNPAGPCPAGEAVAKVRAGLK